MQDKNKKILLNILILSALSLTITSFISPITLFDYSDVLAENGIENPDWYWTRETSFLFAKNSVYYTKGITIKKGYEYHAYSIFFGLFKIEVGEKGDWTEISDYNIGKETFLSKGVVSMIGLVFGTISMALFIYFCYKVIMNIYKSYYMKKKYILYIFFTSSLILIFHLIGSYYLIDYYDTENIGFIDFIFFRYGFYLVCIGILLFLISYFIQPYLLNLSNVKKSDNIKM